MATVHWLSMQNFESAAQQMAGGEGMVDMEVCKYLILDNNTYI